MIKIRYFDIKFLEAKDIEILKKYMLSNIKDYEFRLSIPYSNPILEDNRKNVFLKYFFEESSSFNFIRYKYFDSFKIDNFKCTGLIDGLNDVNIIFKGLLQSCINLRGWFLKNEINLAELKNEKNFNIIFEDDKYVNFTFLALSLEGIRKFLGRLDTYSNQNSLYQIMFLNKDFEFISISTLGLILGINEKSIINNDLMLKKQKEESINCILSKKLDEFVLDKILNYYSYWFEEEFFSIDNNYQMFDSIAIKRFQKEFMYISTHGYNSFIALESLDIDLLKKLGFNLNGLEELKFNNNYPDIFTLSYSEDEIGYPIDNEYMGSIIKAFDDNPNILFENGK